MTDATELDRLAEADGATFIHTASGKWWARDKDGITVVQGALSRAEAVLLYCEDKDLTPTTPEAILTRIKAHHRPHDAMPEFKEGFEAYRNVGAFYWCPYNEGVKAQDFDRGVNAAVLFSRALAHLDAHPEVAEKAGPGWLGRLLRTGRVSP
jgi:hypothetical protein